MRKIFENNFGIDIYIDLEKTSYHDPETQKWLWDKAKVIYSGLNTTPIMLLGNNNIALGWEDDGHLCFERDALTLDFIYFKSLLRDGQKLIDTIERETKKKKSKKPSVTR